jgi:hypothetical protein
MIGYKNFSRLASSGTLALSASPVLAAGPFEFTKVLETGQLSPEGRMVTRVHGFGRNGDVTAYAVTLANPDHYYGQNEAIVKQSSSNGPWKAVVDLYTGPGGDYNSPYLSDFGHLDVSKNTTTFGRRWHWDEFLSEYALAQHDNNGALVKSWGSNYSHGAGYGTESRGYIGESVLLESYSSGSSGASLSIELFQNGSVQSLFSGGYSEQNGVYSGHSYSSSRADSRNGEFLVRHYSFDTDSLQYLRWKDGQTSIFHEGSYTLPNGSQLSPYLTSYSQGYAVGYGSQSQLGYIGLFGEDEFMLLGESGKIIPGTDLYLTYTPAPYNISSLGQTVVTTLGYTNDASQKSEAVFLFRNGLAERVIGKGDMLFGSKVTGAQVFESSLTEQGLWFTYYLEDGRSGIASVQGVPEPGTLAALGLGALLLRRRKR